MKEQTEKSNILFLLFAIVFIIFTMIVLIGAYGVYLNKPANYFKTTINNKYLTFNEHKANVFNYNPADSKLESNINIKLESNIDQEKNTVDLINFLINSDVNNEFLKAALNVNEDADENLDLTFSENAVILNTKSLYSKPLILNDDYNINWDYLKNINEDDFDTITKTIKNAFINNLDTKKYKTSKTTLEVNGNNINSKKISYTDKNFAKVYKNIIKDLISDNDFIKAVSNISGKSKSEVKDYLTELQKADIEFKPITINLYTTGLFAKLAKIEIEYDNELYSYMNYKDENYEVIIESGDNKVEFAANLNEDDEYEFKIYYNQKKLASGTLKNENDKIKINYTINIGKSYTGKITITTKKDTDSENAKTIELLLYTNVTHTNYYKLIINTSIKKVKKVNTDVVKNAVKYESLSKKEKKKIDQKIDSIKEQINGYTKMIEN